MKTQFESLKSEKFSEHRLSAEAMLQQRGGKTYDTTEYESDRVSYVYGNGKYYRITTWGKDGSQVDISDTIFKGKKVDMYN